MSAGHESPTSALPDCFHNTILAGQDGERGTWTATKLMAIAWLQSPVVCHTLHCKASLSDGQRLSTPKKLALRGGRQELPVHQGRRGGPAQSLLHLHVRPREVGALLRLYYNVDAGGDKRQFLARISPSYMELAPAFLAKLFEDGGWIDQQYERIKRRRTSKACAPTAARP